MPKATKSGIILSDADAAIAKGMIARGDRQHDIAAWFGVNGGRIAEISTGATFAGVSAQTTGLPPAGPYISGKKSVATDAALRKVRKKLQDIVDEIDKIIATP